MGGKNERTGIGYKHYLGVHFVLCLAQIDHLLRIDVDKRVLWRGKEASGRILVDKPELFDSAIPEGGISGYLDLMSGEKDQPKNDYLISLFNGVASAFRGVTSLVLRQVYLGNSPHLRSWAFKVQRIFISDGGQQWYPEKAAIKTGQIDGSGSAIYIAFDGRDVWSGFGNATKKSAIIKFLEELKESKPEECDIHILVSGDAMGAAIGFIERRDCDDTAFDDLIAWVAAINVFYIGQNNYEAAIENYHKFYTGRDYIPGVNQDPFGDEPDWGDRLSLKLHDLLNDSGAGSGLKRRVAFFLADSPATPASEADAAKVLIDQLRHVEFNCINVGYSDTTHTSVLDNSDSGPSVFDQFDVDGVAGALSNPFRTSLDMNPSHIIREVLIAKDTGGTGDESEIGDSFGPAADLFFDEGFGLSFQWDTKGQKRGTFIKIVEDHVDAVTYKDRITGKWEIKPIRNDYTVADLHVFDDSNIIEWSNLSLPTDASELFNQITIEYTDRNKDDVGALTVSNPARVIQAGSIISDAVPYPGIHSASLAARVGDRVLLARSSLLRSGTINVTYLPNGLNLGFPIVLNNPRFNIYDMVVRIIEISDGDGLESNVTVRWVEDKFSLNAEASIVIDQPVLPPVISAPIAASYRMVEEAPYYALVARVGQHDADLLLANDDTIGFLNLACESPTPDSLNAMITVDDGAGYEDTGVADFMIVSETKSTLAARADHTKLLVEINIDLSEIRIGSLALIGDEYVRIDGIEPSWDMFSLDDVFAADDLLGNAALVTLGRGCLDTVPQKHDSGAVLMFWGDVGTSDRVEHFSGEAVSVKLRTKTERGTLRIENTPVDVVTFDQRAIRPYPVGNLQINGEYAPRLAAGNLAITWSHRDRTIQTTGVYEDHTFGDIGPEVGVSYHIKIDLVDSAGATILTVKDESVGGATSYTFDSSEEIDIFSIPDLFALDDIFLTNRRGFKIEVTTVRDGLNSWTSPAITVPILLPPTNLTLTEI